MAYTMDYIPDKTLYAAVMFACKMIREGESAPLAMSIAANYYGVARSDVNFYVSQRSGRRKKTKTSSTKGRKYSYWAVACITSACEGSERTLQGVSIDKGLSKETVEKKYIALDFNFDRIHDTGSYYNSQRWHEAFKSFDDKEKAEKWVQRNYEKIRYRVEHFQPLEAQKKREDNDEVQ